MSDSLSTFPRQLRLAGFFFGKLDANHFFKLGARQINEVGSCFGYLNLLRMDKTTATKSTNPLRRDPADVMPWKETCGDIRCLIDEADLAAAEVHLVEIQDAKLHYHERTDEIYYIIDGTGKLVLGVDEVEVHKGVVIYVPRGVRHKAVGQLTVLTVCIPRGVLGDIHEVE